MFSAFIFGIDWTYWLDVHLFLCYENIEWRKRISFKLINDNEFCLD